jgi:hypothetical protein
MRIEAASESRIGSRIARRCKSKRLRLPPVRMIEMPSISFDRLNDPHCSTRAIEPAPHRLSAVNDLHQYDVQLGVGLLG